MPETGEITRLLGEASRGNEAAMGELLPLVYHELHAIAASYFRRERRDHTLQPTALVHEAYMRLAGQQQNWQNHLQFLSVAAIVMRRVLVDHARAHATVKRGSKPARVPLDDAMRVSEQRADEILAIDEALTRLAALDPRQARLIDLRFFGGLSIEEAAEILQISTPTAKRQWQSARAWLHKQVASRDTRAMGTS